MFSVIGKKKNDQQSNPPPSSYVCGNGKGHCNRNVDVVMRKRKTEME